MDVFKRKMYARCGIGGLHCFCCNAYHGKDKPKLNRMARRVMKHEDNKNINKER